MTQKERHHAPARSHTRPVNHGWAVALTDGRKVARFTGPTAKHRALRYVANLQMAGW